MGEEGEEEAGATEEVEDMAGATFTGHSDAVYCVAVNPKNPSQVKNGVNAKTISEHSCGFMFSRGNRQDGCLTCENWVQV